LRADPYLGAKGRLADATAMPNAVDHICALDTSRWAGAIRSKRLAKANRGAIDAVAKHHWPVILALVTSHHLVAARIVVQWDSSDRASGGNER